MSKKGTVIGLRNLVYAKLVDDPVGGTASYEAPVAIPGAISAVINPNASSEFLFADDGPYDVGSAVGGITLELNVADLDLDTQADLLGHTVSGGVLIRKRDDVPPFVAIGFKTLKSNGKYRYTWLVKGKFVPSEQNNQTKGDSVSFNTPTIQGSFVSRDCDGEWERHIDEDHVDYMPTMGANWFNDPYGGSSDTTPPTVTNVSPADGDTAVALNTTVVWTFSEALALSTVHSGNFMVYESVSGTQVDGELTINAARTNVTFTPAAQLAASTAHTALVTTGVKDLAGNKLAAAHITTFTTTT